MHPSKESTSELHKAQAKSLYSGHRMVGQGHVSQSVWGQRKALLAWDPGKVQTSQAQREKSTHPQGKGSPWSAAATWEALAWIPSVCPVAHAEWWSLRLDRDF